MLANMNERKTLGAQKFDAYTRRCGPGEMHRFCERVATACNVQVKSVYRWRAGTYPPTLESAAVIETMTAGEVSASDWTRPGVPEASAPDSEPPQRAAG